MYRKFIFISAISIISILFIATAIAGPQQTVENFTLPDYNQKQHSLTDYNGSKAIVLMFISTRCPVSNSYNQRMEDLYKKYNTKGVIFLGINANSMEDLKEIKKHALEKEFSFPVLKDDNNVIADKLKASVTPEIFVLNSEGVILYHGRIDDSKNETDVKSPDLKNALNEVLAGKPVTTAKTKVFGCSIKRVEKK